MARRDDLKMRARDNEDLRRVERFMEEVVGGMRNDK